MPMMMDDKVVARDGLVVAVRGKRERVRFACSQSQKHSARENREGFSLAPITSLRAKIEEFSLHGKKCALEGKVAVAKLRRTIIAARDTQQWCV